VNSTNLEVCDENSFQVYRTLSEDERCKPITFLPTKSEVSNSYLASFPGSGNTWARHLIEQASGIYSGSVYGETSLYNGGKFLLLFFAYSQNQSNSLRHAFTFFFIIFGHDF